VTTEASLEMLPDQLKQRVRELRSYDRRTVKVLYRSLTTPPLIELDGEYHAELLHQGDRLSHRLIRAIFRMAGSNWSGKAFQAAGDGPGRGYNCFMERHGIRRGLPMKTYRGPATIAEGSSIILDYSESSNVILRSMRDEVRKWDNGLYVGFGHVGLRLGNRGSITRQIPFVLAGPIRPFAAVA
jgi:hypothetical protein